jgi:hypothetical protein
MAAFGVDYGVILVYLGFLTLAGVSLAEALGRYPPTSPTRRGGRSLS